ncbi:hypothetical protein [Chromohalobacter sp. 11-W]|uniref:hypothetical protein n=1 Tax=Chromohalobacter sp. 11-W TaxID=2994061 RepID=UPI002468ACD3|nr:hypothetical protein [Chromohalobacter sp. 11-W]
MGLHLPEWKNAQLNYPRGEVSRSHPGKRLQSFDLDLENKDYLKARANALGVTKKMVEDAVNSYVELTVCADLANPQARAAG